MNIPGPRQVNGTMHHNIAVASWYNYGFQIKGFKHQIRVSTCGGFAYLL